MCIRQIFPKWLNIFQQLGATLFWSNKSNVFCINLILVQRVNCNSKRIRSRSLSMIWKWWDAIFVFFQFLFCAVWHFPQLRPVRGGSVLTELIFSLYSLPWIFSVFRIIPEYFRHSKIVCLHVPLPWVLEMHYRIFFQILSMQRRSLNKNDFYIRLQKY